MCKSSVKDQICLREHFEKVFCKVGSKEEQNRGKAHDFSPTSIVVEPEHHNKVCNNDAVAVNRHTDYPESNVFAILQLLTKISDKLKVEKVN